ncbi:vasopressin V2 receptor-like [Myiozetetes cayanensis]|uniref:vasopressin V2 receptor-like n=1 Tax=Myiozetetes cayanensis TaxID=478635 RepID=UPI00215F855A|nr:vasopressin V2 receptor-like [Myiozetetes cayanensis]
MTPPDPHLTTSFSHSPHSPREGPLPPRDAALAMAEIGVLSVILVLALGATSCGPGDPPLRPARPLRRYLRHLSLADLSAAAGQVLPQLLWDLTDRSGPDVLCRVTKYLQGVAMFASAYVAVAMAWDRHRAITRPLGAASGGHRGRGARGDSRGSVTATYPLCPSHPHVTPVSPTVHVTSVPPSPNGTLKSPSPCDTSTPPVPHVTPMPPTPNGTPMSLRVPLMSPSPNGTPVTLHVPLMSPSPPSSPQMPSRSLSQATVGVSGTTIGVSGATTEGSWATTEGSQDIMGGFGTTIGVSVATTRVAHATIGEAETNMGESGTTMGASQATAGESGTTRGVSWVTTEGSGTTMEAPQATTRGSGATTGWSQVVTGWAGSALGWARSALGRARRGWDALATAWALSLLFGLPQVGIFGQREVAPGESDCWATFIEPWGARAYITWVALAVLVAPAVLLGGLQLAVTRELREGRGGPGGLGRARAKSHRMAVVVLGVFVLCWTPFFCAQLWAVWDPRAPREGPAFTILMLLASLTSCTNPWISAAFSTSLARAMARVLCPHRHRRTR